MFVAGSDESLFEKSLVSSVVPLGRECVSFDRETAEQHRERQTDKHRAMFPLDSTDTDMLVDELPGQPTGLLQQLSHVLSELVSLEETGLHGGITGERVCGREWKGARKELQLQTHLFRAVRRNMESSLTCGYMQVDEINQFTGSSLTESGEVVCE